MLKHPYENAQRGDPCAELLQSMVSSGIIIFGLKQSSELACNPGMLSSWEILLMEAGLKKLQMLSQWPWVHWLCFWPFSKGLLAPAMRFWGHLLGWAFPRTPEDTSLGNRRFLCSSCRRNVLIGAWLWEGKELGENQCAEGAKGRIMMQGSDKIPCSPLCLISIPSIWSTKFFFSEMVEVRTEFRAVSSCLLVGSWPGFCSISPFSPLQ